MRTKFLAYRVPLIAQALGVIIACAGAGAAPRAEAQVFGCTPPAVNAIVCENSKAGNPPSDWQLPGEDSNAGDPTIQGFTTDISVNQGGTIYFKVKTTATAYQINIYRIGYYGGQGARLVATVLPSVPLPQSQPACLTDPSTLLIDCGNWAVSASWAVPANATSGLYIGKLVRSDTGGANHMAFVVRADTGGSQLLFQTSDTTWHAYNEFEGNSLYSPGYPTPRGYKVSYNRPFVTWQINSPSWFMSAEYPMIRWLEANGYDVSYTTGVDSDRNGNLILGHKIFMSVGHDEYWSGNQRTNVEAARAAGVDLAFFSGNELFWKTRWENSIDGSNTPYRTLVCYKETLEGIKEDPLDPPTWTGSWRDPSFSPPADGGRPENALSGTLSYVNATRNDAIAVPAAYGNLRFWRNTAIAKLAAGSTYTFGNGTLGYEWDEELDNGFRPAGLIDLSSTTVNVTPDFLLDYGATYGAGSATHSLSFYRASSGALVFSAGSVQWSWGLDATHDYFSDQPPPADPNLQQATVNVLADMGAQAGTLQPGLVATTASTDTTPPSSQITSPANGATIHTGSAVTITGTASDLGGGVVAAVEVSVDGGTTWHRAVGQTNWSYPWTPTSAGSATIKSRAVDDSVNLETPSAGVTVSVTPAGLVSISVTPTNASVPQGGSQQFTATGTFTDGSTENLTDSVTWSSTNTAVATVNSVGISTGAASGTVTIQATSGTISGSASLTVVSSVLASIAVTPANPAILSGASVQLTATGTYTDGSNANITSAVTWTSANQVVATVNANGLTTGVSTGNTTVQAALGPIMGTTGLTVTNSISGLVGYWTFNEGSGTTAADSSGDGYNATLFNGVTWGAGKLGDAVTANGTNQYATIPAINLSGTDAVTVAMWVNRTYSTAGGHTLLENSSNFNSSTTGFGIYPDDSTCGGIMVGLMGNIGYSINCYTHPTSGAWHHLAAIFDKSQAGNAQTALYIDGVLQTPKQNYLTSKNTNNFGSNITYLFSRAGTQEFATGSVDDLRVYNRALSASEVQLLYNFNGATLTSISVTPTAPSIAKGGTQQFTATGTYSDGSQQNLTSSVTWTSSSTSVATITGAGLATGVSAGSSTIQAASGTITGSTSLTVTAPTLTSIAVTPANPSIAIGATQQFTATGTFSDGSQQNLTSSVTWSSSSTSIATINTTGLASAVTGGATTIQAVSGSVSGSTTLSVTKSLVSITITPASPSIAKGGTQQFAATGTYSDGSQQNLTSSVTWTSSSTSVATITGAGLATGVAAGSSTIQAVSGAITGSTSLTVTPPTLTSIAVTPANPSIGIGATQQFTATGSYSDGSQQSLTNSVTWSSSNTAAATIGSTGLASGVATGSTTIQAVSGSINGSTTLTVTKTLASIAVTPTTPSIAKGGMQQFTATGTYSDGSQQNLTSSVTWTSSSTSVATITGAGLATGLAAGSTTIQAASGAITGSTSLTVTPPTLTSIAVTPSNPSIGIGATQQFTATGSYSDGSQQNLTTSVSWVSTNTSVATVNAAGLATGIAAGSATIQATLGVIGGSTGLSVTAQLPGLVGYWTFDDGTGTTAADSSGNNYNMTLSGITWTTGMIGDAISASGTKQYGKTPAINLAGTSAVTVTLWVNRTYSTAGGHTLFEDSANFNSSTTGFGFYPDDDTCNNMMVGERGNAGYNINCYAQPSSGVWHHFAVIYDKSQPASGEVTLYIDGVLQTPVQNYMSSNNTNAFGSNILYVFSRGGSSEYTSGLMDDLRIYSRALSASEIQQIYSFR